MDTNLNQKLCKSCNIEKSLCCFYKDLKFKDGYKNDCKKCISEKNKKEYKIKIKKDDDILIAKHEFDNEKTELDKKISLCDDPDELMKLDEEHHRIIEKYRRKLLEKCMSSTFSIVNKGQDDDIIRGKTQEFVMNKKIMLLPSDIKIEKNHQNIKIHLPENIKLDQAERSKIIKSINETV